MIDVYLYSLIDKKVIKKIKMSFYPSKNMIIKVGENETYNVDDVVVQFGEADIENHVVAFVSQYGR